jgi:AAA family ATP:ADP antiporter
MLPPPTPKPTLASRLLGLFAPVEPGEATTALLLTATVFLLLCAYYFLKVVREPLILAGGGAEVKTYAAAGQAAILVVIVTFHGWLARALQRLALVGWIYGFFALCLLGFATAASRKWSIGVPFYLFVGVFSLMVISQFWAFASDVYTEAQGKRLFAIVGVGSSVGAVAGSAIAGAFFTRLGVAGLLVAAACTLAICGGLLAVVDARERGTERPTVPKTAPKPQEAQSSKSGLSMVFGDRYLFGIAALSFLANMVNTTGEYLLDRTLLGSLGAAADAKAQIATFKSHLFVGVNTIGVLLQLFVASRALRTLGVIRVLYILPVIALLGYSTLATVPLLLAVTIAKTAENSVDYSLQSTARQALYLVTTREEKFVAKTFIDTFVVRFGDVSAAVMIAIAAYFHAGTRVVAALNVVLVIAWLFAVRNLGRARPRDAADGGSASNARPSAPAPSGEA